MSTAEATETQVVPNQDQMVTYTSAAQMAAVYNANIEQILKLKRRLNRAVREIREAFPGSHKSLKTFGCSIEICGETEDDKIRREMKRAAWSILISKLGLHRVMSTRKRAEMEKAFSSNVSRGEKDPIDSFPEITPEAMMDVLSGYAASADEFLTESIDEVYNWLKPRHHDGYRTNVKNRWKLSKKVILSYALADTQYSSYFHVSFNDTTSRMLHALDNIMHLLDGKGIPHEHSGPLVTAINGLRISEGGYGQTEYFKFRCCKNRSLHLEFLRLDLVRDFNIRCGHPNELPGDDANPYSGRYTADETVPFAPDGDFELFETPVQLAEDMALLAEVGTRDLVLEPQAGPGRIVRAVNETGATVVCNEAQPHLCDALRAAGYDTTVGNFLTMEPQPKFDAVVMNPPFSHGQDAAHIRHAWEFLKPGGRLVAIASRGVEFRSERRYERFREWLTSVGGTVTILPDGTFSESGTNVATVLIKAVKG